MKIHRALASIALLFVFGQAAFAGSPTQYVQVPMHDGVKLATDVYLPASEGGSWPAIVVRTPYGRAGAPVEAAVQLGFAVVVQDLRGTGQSEGETFIFKTDGWQNGQFDGVDTLAWVRAQSWCNGKIATFGPSALGIVQLLTAPVTKDLSAQFIEVASPNLYEDMFFQGGVFRKELLEGWLPATKQDHLLPVYKSHPRYGEFWAGFNVEQRSRHVTAPAMFVGGWYDIFCQGTIDAFLSREVAGGPGAKGQNFLIMKWCTHGPDVTKDYKLNENRLQLNVLVQGISFLAGHLKGDAAALKALPKIQYYVMGADTPGAPGNEWRTAQIWPPFATASTPFYLTGDGTLSTEQPAAEKAAMTFAFDPKNPVPTCGGANLNIPAGPFDQRPAAEGRTDVLKFLGEPLAAPLEITGRVRARLHVSSDAPDTDFTVKLVDVFPDGREILMLDSIRRVKTRLGYDTVAPLLAGPDDVVELEVDLQSISWIFDQGHRIGVHVSSSNSPRFEVNPNTGADFPEEGEMRVANNTVHMDQARPSAIILPVRPAP